MTISPTSPSPSLLLLILSLVTLGASLRLNITHIDASGNFTNVELLQRSALRGKHRISVLTKNGTVATHASVSEYLIDFAIGTPPRRFSAMLDTGSDLIWTQCTPCTHCYPQSTPLFDPSKSSTYSQIPCNNELCKALPTSTCNKACFYEYSYGDNATRPTTMGVLSTERFNFGSETSQLRFGCSVSFTNGDIPTNSAGIIGFGRGPLSLVAQLRVKEFSYCFTRFSDLKQSPMFLGPVSEITAVNRRKMKSTPLLNYPSHTASYYVKLLGISVGGTRLSIPAESFAVKKDGSGGVIIDSGTTFTRLETPIYEALKREFILQTKLPILKNSTSSPFFDTCFSVGFAKKSMIPRLVFHFEGANWRIPKRNYIIGYEGSLCLTIVPDSELSIFGNMQQQNTLVTYDLEKEMLSFTPAKCDRL